VLLRKRKEAWINLMKIISHELMNSLTPIRSLSQNLLQIVDQDHLETEDFEDIKQYFDHYKQKRSFAVFCRELSKAWLRFLHQTKKTNTNSLFEDCLK
jgi:inactivated superfamily I helicase